MAFRRSLVRGLLALISLVAGTLVLAAPPTAAAQPDPVSRVVLDGGLEFVEVEPCRLVDTRDTTPLAPGSTRTFSAKSAGTIATQGGNAAGCDIPAAAEAIAATYTAVDASNTGFLRTWAAGQSAPQATFLNYDTSLNVSNSGVVPLCTTDCTADFAARVFTSATDLVVDVNGYYAPPGTGLEFYPVTPCRLVDTRVFANPTPPGPTGFFTATDDDSIGAQGGRSGGCGIPETAEAISTTYTVVDGSGTGFLRTWRAGDDAPNATFLNFDNTLNVGNSGVVPLCTDESCAGAVAVRLFGASGRIVVDVNGYYDSPDDGARFHPIDPCRITDTRQTSRLAVNATRTLSVKDPVTIAAQGGKTGGCGIPAEATAYSANYTILDGSNTGFLRTWPSDVAPPNATFVNYNSGLNIGNAGDVALCTTTCTSDVSVRAFTSSARLVIDAAGYFAPADMAPVAPVITDIDPDAGPEEGGTVVTITGSGFTDTSSVTFGGTDAESFTVDSDTQITATTPSSLPPADVSVRSDEGAPAAIGAGPVDVVVTTPVDSATATDGFTYVAEPTIDTIDPDEGSSLGGDSITITGTGFTDGTTVTLDGAAATVTVDSDTELTVVTPAGTAGLVDAVVATAGGDTTAADGFEYVDPPTTTAVTPVEGPTAGGTSVTLVGTGFRDPATVTVNGIPATNVSVNSSTNISFTTPPSEIAGAVDVLVTTSGGTSNPTTFTYLAPDAPTITTVDPAAGPEAGGTEVTITGTNLDEVSAVTFGGTDAASFTIESSTEITAETPAGTGTVDVSVTNPADTATLADGYTYGAAPTITAIDPTSGPTAGGQSVLLVGTGFTGATDVTVNGVSAAFTVDSPTGITLTTPASTVAGPVDVIVTTPSGGPSAPATYTYVAPAAPTVTDVDPPRGALAGGDSVTITGTGFTEISAVTFGGDAAASFTVDSPTQITAETPAGSAGAVDVVVTNPGGDGTLADGFEYVAAPTVTLLTPNEGGTAGGFTVVITGTDFVDVQDVTFDGNSVGSLVVDSDTQLTVTTPTGSAGTVDVVVTTDHGASTPDASSEYLYADAPTVDSIEPAAGPSDGGQEAVISGTGFTASTTVTIGGAEATVTVDSDTEITITTPPGTAGTADVVVTTQFGSGTLAAGYTYVDAPTVDSITPNSGPTAGGTSVTISGTDFTGVTSVSIGGTEVDSFTVDSATTISAVTAASTTGGLSDVVVVGTGGTGTLVDGFDYVAPEPPTITSVSPDEGPADGGTFFGIVGTNLSEASSITVGGVEVFAFGVVDDEALVAVTEAGPPGPADVVVTTPGGVATLANGFTYVAAPVVESLVPDYASAADGGDVTINGTGFTDATAVTFDGDAATTFTVVDDTQITATAPPHAVGDVDVSVTTIGGTGTLEDGLSYLGAPVLVGRTPTHGPTVGGTSVTIIGANFVEVTEVTFGGEPAASFVVDSDEQITAVTPPSATAGSAPITVTAIGGTSGTIGFTYDAPPAPTITDVSPDLGPTAGGTTITITGTNLSEVTGVTVDGTPATSLTLVSPTEITAVTPAGDAGTVSVTVANPGGSATLPAAFTYVPAPTIDGLAPSSGGQGTSVTIAGSDFVGDLVVMFGDNPATITGTTGDTGITVTAPAGPFLGGPVDVVVTALGGTSNTATFSYPALDL